MNYNEVPLGSLVRRKIGYGIVQPGASVKGGVPVIKVNNLISGLKSVSELDTTAKENDNQYTRTKLLGGELIISIVGTIGKTAIVPKSFAGCNLVRATGLIDIPDPTITQWVKYYIDSPKGQAYIVQNLNTTVQPTLNIKSLVEMPIPIPDEITIKQVVKVLSCIDNKIELNNRINENLEQQLKTTFGHWFVDDARDEWEEKRIGDFLRLERGLSYKGKFLSENEGVPMLNLGNILPNSVFRPEKLKFYTGEFKSKVIVQPGDIIVANTDLTQAREVLGSAIRVPELDYPTIICSHHISIVRDCSISKNFVLGLLNLPSYRERVIGYATGTTVLALPNDALLNCTFKCPPDSLINEYDSFANSYYAKIELLRKENKRLEELRDSLLPRLIDGTIYLDEAS